MISICCRRATAARHQFNDQRRAHFHGYSDSAETPSYSARIARIWCWARLPFCATTELANSGVIPEPDLDAVMGPAPPEAQLKGKVAVSL